MNFSYESGNFLNSILLGKSGNGNKEINDALRKTGLSHIVVVSGMHFAIINMFIIFLLRRMGIKRKTSSLISPPDEVSSKPTLSSLSTLRKSSSEWL
jgi:predicted membrane metal-binding protein